MDASCADVDREHANTRSWAMRACVHPPVDALAKRDRVEIDEGPKRLSRHPQIGEELREMCGMQGLDRFCLHEQVHSQTPRQDSTPVDDGKLHLALHLEPSTAKLLREAFHVDRFDEPDTKLSAHLTKRIDKRRHDRFQLRSHIQRHDAKHNGAQGIRVPRASELRVFACSRFTPPEETAAC
jgi:hypothetical protein